MGSTTFPNSLCCLLLKKMTEGCWLQTECGPSTGQIGALSGSTPGVKKVCMGGYWVGEWKQVDAGKLTDFLIFILPKKSKRKQSILVAFFCALYHLQWNFWSSWGIRGSGGDSKGRLHETVLIIDVSEFLAACILLLSGIFLFTLAIQYERYRY